MIGAAAGLAGVLLGAWLAGRREDKNWLRDQRLRGAVEFIVTSAALYDRLLQLPDTEFKPSEKIEWHNRIENGRTTIHLLCSPRGRELMDTLIRLVKATTPTASNDHRAQVIHTLQMFTTRMRAELGSDVRRARIRATSRRS
ncbi:hypothetical protein GCM10027569_71560 [Flindersiella endophytica]